jgi:hypothetical protein
MKILLKESELVDLIKKIVNEATTNDTGFGFGLIFAFPDYDIKGYGGESTLKKVSRTIHGGSSIGSYGKLGHGGVILVDSLGNTYLFEFGRYGTPQGWGKVMQKNLGRIGKIGSKAGIFGSKPSLLNAKDVASIAKSNTQGSGPSLKMTVAVVRLPDFKGALDFAKGTGDLRKYAELDVTEGGAANCGTYANDVLNSGGITNLSPICNPYPNQIVKSFYPVSDEYFTV